VAAVVCFLSGPALAVRLSTNAVRGQALFWIQLASVPGVLLAAVAGALGFG